MPEQIPELVKKETLLMDNNAKIILFGSRARNESVDDSDWDFLILSEKANSSQWKSKMREKLYELELESDAVISSIIHTPKKWGELTVTPLYKNIAKEGIAV